jgi:hypothetical protein
MKLRTATPGLAGNAISLAHPAFALALALLLANDFVLKAAYPGWVTGKLSDFAGLFVLPYFLAWLWPARRTALHVGVALAFVAWKLPLSRPFVELWNAAPWFDVARVEDLSDLIALASVALSFHATARATTRVVHVPAVAIACIALFAFTATSKHYEKPVHGAYLFEGTPAELRQRLEAFDVYVDEEGNEWSVALLRHVQDGEAMDCVDSTRVRFSVKAFRAATLVELASFSGRCELDAKQVLAAVHAFNRIALAAGLDPGTANLDLPKRAKRLDCPPDMPLPTVPAPESPATP